MSMSNVGSTDKTIRIVVGIVALVLSFMSLGGVGSTAGIVALVIGAVLIVTALINFCPAYKIINFSSRK